MPTAQFSKVGEKNVQLAGMITPEVITDVFRANGAILLLNKLGVIDQTILDKFEECFDELRTTLVGVKGIVSR